MTRLPNEVAVRELLTAVVGSDVPVRYTPGPALYPADVAAAARYVDDQGVLRAVAGCDLAVANALGHALALLPQRRAADAVSAGTLPPDAAENLREVFDVTTSVLNAPDLPHLRLDDVLIGSDVPPEIVRQLTSAPERLDLHVDVPGYGGGPLVLVLPAELSAPGLEELPAEDEGTVVHPEPTPMTEPPAAPDGSLDAFDFEAPLPLPATAPRLVGRVQDVSPRIGVALSVACGRTVVVTCTGAERVSSGHLAQAGGVTWCYVDCGAFGKAILVVPAALTVTLADTLMGGSGKGTSSVDTGRPATTLEQRLVLRHLGPALQPLVLAFAANGLDALVVGEPETHALPASIGDLVALRLQTSIEGAAGADTVTLALPARALLPGADLRVAEPPAATAAALGEVPVELSLRLSPTPMSAAEVESLRPGDVVRLEHPVDRPLLGLLDDHVVLHATLGRRGRRRAVLVTDLLGGS